MDFSIIVRAYNEARWLPALLERIREQHVAGEIEVILVDSGSSDATVEIAKGFGCRIVSIAQGAFTFGRSLNRGCAVARGRILVFVSAHCLPVRNDWLQRLTEPLEHGHVAYSYGRQIGHELTKFSEHQIFKKYFAETSRIPQHGFFCNNANAALPRPLWHEHPFDEEVTGLEDMELAKRLVARGQRIGYVAEAPVFHIHEESWSKVKKRYEREAIALQKIMPEIHVHFSDFLRYFFSAVFFDAAQALEERKFTTAIAGIVMFRLMQYWGSWRGNNDHRRLSAEIKHSYFYPK